MKITAKQLNPQALLEAASLIAVAAWLGFELISKRYLVYVTPRMTLYLIGAVVALCIWAGIALARLFRPAARPRVLHAFLLTIPLLLLLLPHGDVSAASGSFNTSGVSAAQTSAPDSAATAAPVQAGNDQAQNKTQQNETTQSTETSLQNEQEAIAGLDRENKTITISTDDFYAWVVRIYNETEAYEGYTVSITGYVINDSTVFAPDEFAVARLLMSCCVADLSPLGLICRYDQAADLTADGWVSVVGTLTLGSYEADGQQYAEPQLTVTSIAPAEEIAGYIYPY